MLLKHVPLNHGHSPLFQDLLPGRQAGSEHSLQGQPARPKGAASPPLPPSLPQPLADASQVGQGHQSLKVLQACALQVQEADQGPHHLVDLWRQNTWD